MKTRPPAFSRAAQRGYSLAEILVVMAVFTVIIVAALMIYDRSNKTFKESVEASDMQQSTRVAFDKLVADIRLAGFDYDRDGVPFGSLSSTWKATTAYIVGNLVQPNPPNGHVYICIGGGTSSAGGPTEWKTGKNDTFDDGSVKWQEDGQVQYQQPDEQVEYAGDRAITIRANFNYETALGACPAAGACKQCENGREQCLESSQFPLVTTANSEIVTYALVSNSGNANANKDTVSFYADVDEPRDVNPGTGKKEAKIDVTGIDLTDKYPPYTLYRYTLDDDGKAVGVPIADNIRTLKVRYFTDSAASDIPDGTGKTHEIGCGDATKCEVANLPLGNGQYDGTAPDTTVAERDTRASIKAIRLTLVGMNPSQDIAFTDTDAYAPHYRKLQLDTIVVPRNLGKHGMKEFTTDLPGPPSIQTACNGACEAVYVTWKAPSTGGDIDSYNLLYNAGDCSASPLTFAFAEDEGKNLSGFASKMTPGTQYRVAVQAVNKYGSANSTINGAVPANQQCVTITPINKTTPVSPVALDASGGGNPTYSALANQVDLYWNPSTTNNPGAETCLDGTNADATEIPWAEKVRYRIYRGANAGFAAAAGNMILNETSAVQPTATGTQLKFSDKSVGNCVPIYYRIQTVNTCIANAAYNQGNNLDLADGAIYPDPGANAILGEASTTAKAATPTGLSFVNDSCAATCTVTFTWTPVTTDTSGTNPLNVIQYSLSVKQAGADVAGSPFPVFAANSKQVTGLDPALPYTITVTAINCVNSDPSPTLTWPCNWIEGGTAAPDASNTYGGDGSSGNPWIIQTPVNMNVTTSVAIKQVEFTVLVGNSQTVLAGPTVVSGPGASFSYALPDTPDGTVCRVRMVMTNAAGTCSNTIIQYILDQPAGNCALRDDGTDGNVVTFPGNPNKVANVVLKNSSTEALALQKIIVVWNTGYAGGSPTLDTITYPNTSSGNTTQTINCGTSTVVANVSADAADIPASGSSGNIQIAFSKNGVTDTTISKICIVYKRKTTGDILACPIYPNNGTACTNLSGGTCQ